MFILEISGWKLRKILSIEGIDKKEVLIPACCDLVIPKISIVKFVAVSRLRGIQGFCTPVLIQEDCNTRETGIELALHDDGGDHPDLSISRCEPIQ
jgi:hypothetical protein